MGAATSIPVSNFLPKGYNQALRGIEATHATETEYSYHSSVVQSSSTSLFASNKHDAGISTTPPYESGLAGDYFYLVIELPGVRALSDIDCRCTVVDTGYEVIISASKHSVLNMEASNLSQKESSDPTQISSSVATNHPTTNWINRLGAKSDSDASTKCMRHLGHVRWHGRIHGVFDDLPEVNYRNGILRMRFKKRLTRQEQLVCVSF